MPLIVTRIVSLETRKKLSLAHMGHKTSPATREKIRQGNLGRKHSLDTKAKIGKASLGRRPSPETEAKRLKSRQGYKHSSETKEKLKTTWTAEKRMAFKKKMKALWTDEMKLAFRKACKERWERVERPKWNNAKREEARRRQLKQVQRYGRRYNDTEPERTVEAYLKELGVKYLKQQPVEGFLVDFYIPNKKLIIEVDGCKWHACDKCFPKPDGWFCKTAEDVVRIHMKDAIKDNKWYDKGYKVL